MSNTYFGYRTKFCEFGLYLRQFQDKSKMIYVCSDNFYLNASVECLLSKEFYGLMRLEIAYNEDFPFTVYL